MLRPLTERDIEVLNELVAAQDEVMNRMDRAYARTVGFCPREFGGRDGSDHGKIATKLVGHGFVEQKPRWRNWGDPLNGGPKVYRPTRAGRDALAAFRTLKRGEMLKPAGNRSKFGHSVPTSSYQPLTDEDRKSLRLKCHLEVPT